MYFFWSLIIFFIVEYFERVWLVYFFILVVFNFFIKLCVWSIEVVDIENLFNFILIRSGIVVWLLVILLYIFVYLFLVWVVLIMLLIKWRIDGLYGW